MCFSQRSFCRIRSGAVTPTRLVEACLSRIQLYNPKLNAFMTALAKAGKLRRPLHGIPIALKDNSDTPAFVPPPPAPSFTIVFPKKLPSSCRASKPPLP